MIALVSMCQGEGFGAETNLENLIRGWSRRDPPIHVASPAGSRLIRVAREVGVACTELQDRRDTIVRNLRSLNQRRAAFRGVRLVHGWNSRSFDGAVWLGSRLNVPTSATLLDDPTAAFHGKVRRRMIRYAANRLDLLLCVSRAVEKACSRERFRCATRTIHCGLEDREIRRSAAEGAVRIGFLGMYAFWKGFPLIESWIPATVAEEGVRWLLYGETIPEFQARARRLVKAYPDRVLLAGYQEPDSIFAGIDILVHASTHFDPLPNVLIEAARAGIPAIAADIGGTSEIVVEGDTGYLFDPEDPEQGLDRLRQLIAQKDLREAMGAKARRRFETHFQVPRMSDEYAEAWTALLNHS